MIESSSIILIRASSLVWDTLQYLPHCYPVMLVIHARYSGVTTDCDRNSRLNGRRTFRAERIRARIGQLPFVTGLITQTRWLYQISMKESI